jgi:hypothetical protein
MLMATENNYQFSDVTRLALASICIAIERKREKKIVPCPELEKRSLL